jgi:hypothetical protein
VKLLAVAGILCEIQSVPSLAVLLLHLFKLDAASQVEFYYSPLKSQQRHAPQQTVSQLLALKDYGSKHLLALVDESRLGKHPGVDAVGMSLFLTAMSMTASCWVETLPPRS